MAAKRTTRRKVRPTTKRDPHWLLIQKVVAFLEKSLTPYAVVLHDRRLPNITTGHKRQCDVVIKYGKPPRQMTAIVEVQKRRKKVDPHTLDGWWKKKEAVGAQRLICVSALDYPQSVKDAVAKVYGPSVVLLRLRELESGAIPPGLLLSSMLFRIPEGRKAGPHGVVYGEGLLGPGSVVTSEEQKLFKEGSSEPSTMTELINEHFERAGAPLGIAEDGTYRAIVVIDVGVPLWSDYKGQRQRILRLEMLSAPSKCRSRIFRTSRST